VIFCDSGRSGSIAAVKRGTSWGGSIEANNVDAERPRRRDIDSEKNNVSDSLAPAFVRAAHSTYGKICA